VAEPRQGALGVALHRHAARRPRRLLAPHPRPQRGGWSDRGAFELPAPQRMANRAFGDPDLRRRLPDRLPGPEQLHDPLALLGGEPVGTSRPALTVDHPEHPMQLQLAVLSIERGAVDVQRRAELLLPRQAQRDHLRGHDPTADRIIGTMDEQRHARGEVRNLRLPLDHRHDGVDLPSPRGLNR
jgi:hypothetical protein